MHLKKMERFFLTLFRDTYSLSLLSFCFEIYIMNMYVFN